MAEFTAQRTERGDEIMLLLSGELDLSSAEAVAQAARGIPPGGALTLDLSKLTFVDSSGLRVFMNLDRRSRREGWTLSIINPGGQVLRILRLCGFDERLPINNGDK